MLDQGAAERDDEHLEAAADTQDGYAGECGRAHEGHLVVVPAAVEVEPGRRVAAVTPRVDVAASGEHERVDEVEQPGRVAGREDQWPAARGRDPVGVRPGRAGDVEDGVRARDGIAVSHDADDGLHATTFMRRR